MSDQGSKKGEIQMMRRNYRPEQSIDKVRDTEIFLSRGLTTGEATRKIEVIERTYYRYRRRYGGMRIDEVKQPKEPEPGRLIV